MSAALGGAAGDILELLHRLRLVLAEHGYLLLRHS